ncbi:MAG TPA: DeoR/GlpR family DNA-binding transcription regulator [Gaiellales bacterium]|nr:DeoR/GlpR family DNA-binding transcription regulator [Gaiellales bacterium]
MLAVDRRHRILERVAEEQTIHIRELAHDLGVSEMTIRRDITRLERDGFLRRTYGGATAHVTRSLELAFNARALQSASAKRLIGMAAAPLVAGASTIFIGTGTTAEQLALYLPARDDVTIITNSLPVASLLGTRPGRVVILGGGVRRHELCCVGPVASATVRRYHADVAVLSAAGLSARAGMTELDDETAEVHRLMTEHSDALVAVADGSKLGAVAAAVVVPIEAITTLVTDETAEAGEREALRARGVNVMVAPRAPDRRARASANGARAEGGT